MDVWGRLENDETHVDHERHGFHKWCVDQCLLRQMLVRLQGLGVLIRFGKEWLFDSRPCSNIAFGMDS